MADSKYKPLSFSTTMRNPERIASFLQCIKKYNGSTLTNGLIDKIVFDIIKNKLYRPLYVNRNPELKDIFESDTDEFTNEQIREIVENSPQKHKEAGFDMGWPSRFDTWYKLPMEFGFVWYEIGKPIVVTDLGIKLINATLLDKNEELVQDIFLNSLARYQTNNPFRKISNANNPLMLLLRTIRLLRDLDKNFKGISRLELCFLICWTNDDAESLSKKILHFRKTYGVSKYTEELIYNECLNILGYGEKDKSYIKMQKITSEAVDEYVRKMRITGIFSLRGNGRFLDWNTLEIEKITYLLDNYSGCKTFSDKESYFKFVSTTDTTLFIESTNPSQKYDVSNIRQGAIKKFATDYTKEFIENELINLSRRQESKDNLLKFIPAPARFEFLVSIALVQHFEKMSVNPNYPIDDEGIPTSTASGGMGDIECKEDGIDELIEVSLMQGRKQVNDEMLPITRHLSEKISVNQKSFAVFIAPSIHQDALQYSEWILYKNSLDIRPLTIVQFIDTIKEYASLYEISSINLE